MLDQIMLVEHDPATPESLVKEAAQGHADIVQEIITKYPDQVRKRLSSRIQSPVRWGAPLITHTIPNQVWESLSSYIQSPVR